MSTLNSRVIIARNIKIDKDYKNVLNYSESNMLDLLLSQNHLVKQDTTYQFINVNNKIRVNFTYQECLQANYIAFQNPNYSNKWFFGWIENVEFKSNNCCEITYSVDAWSTWFSYWEQKPCYVIREHVSDDTIGVNIIDENLELGNYIINEEEDVDSLKNLYIIIASTIDLLDYDTTEEKYKGLFGNVIAGCFNGIGFFACPLANYIYLQGVLSKVDDSGQSNGILSMFMIPATMVNTVKPITSNNPIQKISSVNNINYAISKKTDNINGYVPKNNKLFTSPFNLLSITNYSGSSANLKYEFFTDTNCTFNIVANLNINENIKMYPKNYMGSVDNFDSGLLLSNYPQCAWSSDIYKNYIAQNQNQLSMSFLSTGLSTVGSVLSGVISANPLMIGGSIANGFSQILGTISKLKDTQILPDQAKGNSSSSVNVSANKQTFGIKKITIDYQHAKIIDNFFSRYGYKICEVKIPNITGRPNFNYIEIGNGESIGYSNGNISVPSEYMEIINKACQNGVTIWHNHENIGNYLLDNTI